MTAIFGKKPQGQGLWPAPQPANPGALPAGSANSKAGKVPDYYPPPGVLYGTDPEKMNVAIRRYLLNASKQAQRLGTPAGGTGLGGGLASSRPRLGTGLLGGGLTGTGTRLGTGLLGGGLRGTSLMPNSGTPGAGGLGIYGSAPLNAQPARLAGGYGYGGQQGGMGGYQQSSSQDEITATGPNGHRIAVRNGQWVDAQTGQPIR